MHKSITALYFRVDDLTGAHRKLDKVPQVNGEKT